MPVHEQARLQLQDTKGHAMPDPDIDSEPMQRAINLASTCKPLGNHIPKVGAVIAIHGAIIASGHRGSGRPDDDNHAELNALNEVHDPTQLHKVTLYTTLEPCTPEVRADPLNCCTEHILRSQIKKVFIGILDPNQGVRGKGLWELQSHGISVQLFPPELARQIRSLNQQFIKFQQSIGIKIKNPTHGQLIELPSNNNAYEASGTFENEPTEPLYAFTQYGGKWWPQPHSVAVLSDPKEWKVTCYFGANGLHTVHIVKATEIGHNLVSYYRRVRDANLKRNDVLRECLPGNSINIEELIKKLPGVYHGISLGAKLPKGLQSLAEVEVDIVRKK